MKYLVVFEHGHFGTKVNNLLWRCTDQTPPWTFPSHLATSEWPGGLYHTVRLVSPFHQSDLSVDFTSALYVVSMSHYRLVICYIFCHIDLFLSPTPDGWQIWFKNPRKQNGRFCVELWEHPDWGPCWVQDPLLLFLYCAFEMPGKRCQGVFIIMVAEICCTSARSRRVRERPFLVRISRDTQIIFSTSYIS